MGLPAFGAGYRAGGQGGRPYHPVMMATLLVYCYCRGRRSSREIEMATFDDVGARVICGGLHPGHSTVAEFARRHLEAVCALLPEPVKACAAEGLVDLSLVAGDGTKLKANAAMAANLTREQLDAQIAELEALIGTEFRGWVQDMPDGEGTAPAGPGAASGDGGGPGDGGTGHWKKKPRRAAQMLESRLAARGRLDGPQDKDQGRPGARIAELAARIARKEAAVRRREPRPPPGWRTGPPGSPPGRRPAAGGPSPPSARTAMSGAPGRPWTRPARPGRPPAGKPPLPPRTRRPRSIPPARPAASCR